MLFIALSDTHDDRPAWLAQHRRFAAAMDAALREIAMSSTLPLDWTALLDRARRPRLPSWRGELPQRRHESVALYAPVAIAACAQFRGQHSFRTEAEAATFQWVAPRASNVVIDWTDARYERDACRDRLMHLRTAMAERLDCRATGSPTRAATMEVQRQQTEFRSCWRTYRKTMHRMRVQLDWVRAALSPRPVETATQLLAAE